MYVNQPATSLPIISKSTIKEEMNKEIPSEILSLCFENCSLPTLLAVRSTNKFFSSIASNGDSFKELKKICELTKKLYQHLNQMPSNIRESSFCILAEASVSVNPRYSEAIYKQLYQETKLEMYLLEIAKLHVNSSKENTSQIIKKFNKKEILSIYSMLELMPDQSVNDKKEFSPAQVKELVRSSEIIQREKLKKLVEWLKKNNCLKELEQLRNQHVIKIEKLIDKKPLKWIQSLALIDPLSAIEYMENLGESSMPVVLESVEKLVKDDPQLALRVLNRHVKNQKLRLEYLSKIAGSLMQKNPTDAAPLLNEIIELFLEVADSCHCRNALNCSECQSLSEFAAREIVPLVTIYSKDEWEEAVNFLSTIYDTNGKKMKNEDLNQTVISFLFQIAKNQKMIIQNEIMQKILDLPKSSFYLPKLLREMALIQKQHSNERWRDTLAKGYEAFEMRVADLKTTKELRLLLNFTNTYHWQTKRIDLNKLDLSFVDRNN